MFNYAYKYIEDLVNYIRFKGLPEETAQKAYYKGHFIEAIQHRFYTLLTQATVLLSHQF